MEQPKITDFSREWKDYKKNYNEKIEKLRVESQERQETLEELAENYKKLNTRRNECKLTSEIEAFYLEKSRMELLMYSLNTELLDNKFKSIYLMMMALNNLLEIKSKIEFE